MAHTTSSFDRVQWLRRRGWLRVVTCRGKRGTEAGEVSWRIGGKWRDRGLEVRMAAEAGRRQWCGFNVDGSITTMMGHIWWDRGKGQGISFLWGLQRGCAYSTHTNTHTHTHLDCGSVSVLSFSSSSETSVSRISGLDLFPYLRHKERHMDRWTDTQRHILICDFSIYCNIKLNLLAGA